MGWIVLLAINFIKTSHHFIPTVLYLSQSRKEKHDNVKYLIHRHLPSPTRCIYVSRITEISTNKNNIGNGSSVILICQMRQKYCRDLRGKKREGFDPQTSSPTLCIYVSRIAEISTNKRKFSNIDLPERAKVLPGLWKGKKTWRIWSTDIKPYFLYLRTTNDWDTFSKILIYHKRQNIATT